MNRNFEKSNKPKRRKPRRRPLSGRHWILIGSICLMLWAGYELYVRFDDAYAWCSGIKHLAETLNQSFLDCMRIVMETEQMRELGMKLFFLLGTELFGVAGLCLRHRGAASAVLLVLDGALVYFGARLGVLGFETKNLVQMLKLIPMALIVAGCIINLIQGAIRAARRRNKKRRMEE